MVDTKWDLEEIIWNELIPNTLKIGRYEILPQKINQRSSQDLRDFIRVFTGLPFCGNPTVSRENATLVAAQFPSTGLPRGTYIYQFTSTTDFDTEKDIVSGITLGCVDKAGGYCKRTLTRTPVKPLTLTVTDGFEVLSDNGSGLLTGNMGGNGTVNYASGDLVFRFGTATSGTIKVSYTVRKFGETRPCDPIKIDVPDDDTIVRWSFEGKFCSKSCGIRVYRTNRLGYGSYPYGLYEYGNLRSSGMCLRHEIPNVPSTWDDDGSDGSFDPNVLVPVKNTAQYFPDILDPSITLDEIRNKIRGFVDMIDIDKIPEKLLDHLLYFLFVKIVPEIPLEEQIVEIKKQTSINRIKSTEKSYRRMLRRIARVKSEKDGFPYVDPGTDIYTPHLDILKFSHSALSGTKYSNRRGCQQYSCSGKLYINGDGYAELEDTKDPVFAQAREGDIIRMPREGGPKDGFMISRVIDPYRVEIPCAAIVFWDPRYRGMTEIPVSYFYVIPGPTVHHIQNWNYYHHGVYEIFSKLNRNDYYDQVRGTLHPAGTRLVIYYLIELAAVYFRFRVDVAEMHMTVNSVPKKSICGMLLDVGPGLSTKYARLSGCISTTSSYCIQIDSSWPDQDRVGILNKGSDGSIDRIPSPWGLRVKEILAVNHGGMWNWRTRQFDGGITYPPTNWVLVKNEGVFPYMYYLRWRPNVLQPHKESPYQVSFRLDGLLPVPMRRVSGFPGNLTFDDLPGTIGFLAPVLPAYSKDAVWWSENNYCWNDEILYQDAQPPHEMRLVIHTGLDPNPQIQRGPGSDDRFYAPVDYYYVTSVVQVNQGGVWDNAANAFVGGVDFLENVDWEYHVDDTTYPHSFNIRWGLGGNEPIVGSWYDIVYTVIKE